MIIGVWLTKEVYCDRKKLSLQDSLKIVNHSQTGFNWGYAGSGPAQLAAAILAHYKSASYARNWYQALKSDIIAQLPQNNFSIADTVIEDWIQRHKGETL